MTLAIRSVISNVNHDLDMEPTNDDTAMHIDDANADGNITTESDVEFDDTHALSPAPSPFETIHQTIEGSHSSADGSSEEGSTTKIGYSASRKHNDRKRRKSGRFRSEPKRKRPKPVSHKPRDAYRKLLNEYIQSINNPTEVNDADELIGRRSKREVDVSSRPVTTRIGATVWSTIEQDQMFSALSRYGVHDLPAIARAVTTKSLPEIRHYLDVIGTATVQHELKGRRDRLWEGAAAIPAAVEIRRECELALDKAADHLKKREDRYDKDNLQQSWGDWGVLDWAGVTELSQDLDEDILGIETRRRREKEKQKNRQVNVDDHESRESTPSSDSADELDAGQQPFRFLEPVHPSASPVDRLRPAVTLLNLPNFLDLSARVFMNPHVSLSSKSSPVDHHNSDRNWYTMQTKKSRSLPSITAPCALDFLNLTIILTKRLMSTALHIANSRSRATDVLVKYRGSPFVNGNDVKTACRVLQAKTSQDWREWWRLAARRNALRVVDTKGGIPLRRGRKGILSVVGEKVTRRLRYAEVEKRLEAADDDETDDGTDDGGENMKDDGDLPADNEADSRDEFFSLTSDEDGELSDTNAPSVTWTSSSPSASPPGSPRTNGNTYSPKASCSSPPLPPEMIAEFEAGELETAHLEYIDAASTKAEEARVFALLNLPVPAIEGENADDELLPKLPKLPPRKRKEPKDLVAWYDDLLPPNPESNRRLNNRFSATSAPSGEYISEWQAYCGQVPASAFARTQEEWAQSRKRKRADEKRLLEQRKRSRTVPENGDVLEEIYESDSGDSGKDVSSDSDNREDNVDEDDMEEHEELDDKVAKEDDVDFGNDVDDDDLILDADDADDDANDLDDLLVQQSDNSEDSEDDDDGATTTSQGTEAEEQDDHIRESVENKAIPNETSAATSADEAMNIDSNTTNPKENTSTSSLPPNAPQPTHSTSPPALTTPQLSATRTVRHHLSRPRRSAAPSNLQVNVQPVTDGEEDAAWPAYLAHRLGGIAEEEEDEEDSEGEWVDGANEDE